ncbi:MULTISPECIES: GbsR/MarR family transcriptional regulator [Bizionia]|uniref:Transcriptional regulator n=1 Tax=Bizionia algoritergicola TaxID=291187 RepID=A0A5D0R154_9FLAO|nr:MULTISPECIES: transcriptional regulator [Bizionia]OBX24338.1 transcriptional regulator [Bizionia sp. APA-3]TYB75260.1 transcriptional regulator [Bizionia algoritergicola]
MTNEICNQKQRLVEKLGVAIEQKDQLAPIAARILSYIILTGKVGSTFEDLVSNLCASKSTISTHLNHLADMKKLLYFTKPGDRKKYYTINHDNIMISIEAMIESWNSQKELHLEIRDYKKEANRLGKDETSKFELDFHEDYIKFLEEATQSISKLKSNIIEKKHKF